MKKSVFVALIACAVLIYANAAQAQVKAGRQFLNLNVGGVIPLTKTDLGDRKEIIIKKGMALGGQYIYQLTPVLGFGGELNYFAYGEQDIDSHNMENKAAAITGLAVVRCILAPENPVHPYLTAGLGYGRMTTQTRPIGGAVWGDTLTSEWRDGYYAKISGPAFSLGMGVEGKLSDTIVVGAGLRWFRITSIQTVDHKIEFHPGEKSRSTQGVAITASIGWKFGE